MNIMIHLSCSQNFTSDNRFRCTMDDKGNLCNNLMMAYDIEIGYNLLKYSVV